MGRLSQRHPGFTLVEVLIVVMIIGILGAVAVEAVGGGQSYARQAAATQNMRNVKQTLTLAKIREGLTDRDIDADWFIANPPPPNPAVSPDVHSTVFVQNGNASNLFDPGLKVIRDNSPNRSGYWYNPANGAFRARVSAELFDDPDTVYAEINQ